MVSSLVELGTDPKLQHESSAVELTHPSSLLTFLYCACVHPFLDPAVPLLQPPSAAVTSLGQGGKIFLILMCVHFFSFSACWLSMGSSKEAA